VVGGLSDLENSAGVRNCLDLSKQLLSRVELADDLLWCMPGALHVENPAQSGRMWTFIHPGPISGDHALSARQLRGQLLYNQLDGQSLDK